MATSVKPEDLAEHLKCAICLETFKDPKVLCCQHLYCRKCLERLVTRVGKGHFEITCPECRRETEVRKKLENLTDIFFKKIRVMHAPYVTFESTHL